MSSIQRLSDDVINKIAAGEVVERPASVVKELCENAIDAQATQIHVTLQSGGTEGISINDNGKGISSDQALLAFERHATSKLQCADDLFAIASMGFRGEALASIAAVSKLQMTTRIADADSGTRVVIEGGALKANERWAGAQGTTIAVNELFYNVPARRAFLKSPTTELSHVVEMLQMLSLAHPEISFEVENNGKPRWRCDAVSSQEESGSELLMGELALRQRVSDIWSQEISNKLIYAQRTGEFAHMEALFSTPGNHRGNARQQVIVVNGRVIKDRGIKSAIHRAFHSHILPGQYPSIILNFQIPASLIDVNVHPAKSEVRLQYASDINSLAVMMIREALRQGSWSQDQGGSSDGAGANSSSIGATLPEMRRAPPQMVIKSPAQGSFGFGSGRMDQQSFTGDRLSRSIHANQQVEVMLGSASSESARKLAGSIASYGTPAGLSDDLRAARGAETVSWHDFRFAGEIFSCYLMFEGGDQFLMVDQHAWHERILYERLLANMGNSLESQKLLVPDVLERSAQDIEVIRSRQKVFEQLGFAWQILDDNLVEITAVPSLLKKRSLETLLDQLIDQCINDQDEAASLNDKILHDLFSTFACHAAVRSGERLDHADVQKLMDEAATVNFDRNCPHGRPVYKVFSKSMVEGWFDRS